VGQLVPVKMPFTERRTRSRAADESPCLFPRRPTHPCCRPGHYSGDSQQTDLRVAKTKAITQLTGRQDAGKDCLPKNQSYLDVPSPRMYFPPPRRSASQRTPGRGKGRLRTLENESTELARNQHQSARKQTHPVRSRSKRFNGLHTPYWTWCATDGNDLDGRRGCCRNRVERVAARRSRAKNGI